MRFQISALVSLASPSITIVAQAYSVERIGVLSRACWTL